MAQLSCSESTKPNQHLPLVTFEGEGMVPAASVDASGIVYLANESFCSLLGRPIEDVLGKSSRAFGDSEFGNALASIPLEDILTDSKLRALSFYAGQFDGQDIQIVCSVARLAGGTPAQLLLVVRPGHRLALSLPIAGSAASVLGDGRTVDRMDEACDDTYMDLRGRALRRMLDRLFGQAQRDLHVNAMAVYAPFTFHKGLAFPGKVIYASDEGTESLLTAQSPLDTTVLAAIVEGQSHVYCVGANQPAAATSRPFAWLVAPMRVNNEIIGLTVFSFVQPVELPSNVDELVVALAQQFMVAYGADRLLHLASSAVVLHERERLAREMHDAVMQSVYSLTLFAEAGRRLASMGQIQRVEDNLQMLSKTAQQALSEMRLLLYELKPAVLEQAGLVEALRQRLDAVERRTGMVVRLHVEGNPQLAAPLEDGLYRVCYEALNNTLKHSSATEVTVTLRTEGESVHLQICDNGIGFDPDSLRALNGEGIATMRERVRRMNGTLIIESAAQQGTCVNVLLKFPHQFEVDV